MPPICASKTPSGTVGNVTPVEASSLLGSFVHLLEKFCVIDSLLSLQSMLWPPER